MALQIINGIVMLSWWFKLPVRSLSWRTADEGCIRPAYIPPPSRQDSDDNESASRCAPDK